jgi:hypothetical protein
VEARLAKSSWDVSKVEPGPTADAAEVAVFALNLAGKGRAARRGGRFGRLVSTFALAACLALASVVAACDKPDSSAEETAEMISQLPNDSAANASVAAQPRAGPAQYTDLLVVDPGTDAQPWATVIAPGGTAPILVDRVGSGLDTTGGVYQLPAQPVTVGTRDGTSQFLDPLVPATSTGSSSVSSGARDQLVQPWAQDERYLAAARAVAGTPTVLDAAYNAEAAYNAGGTHTYRDGVILRVDPDNPVLQVIDRALLESGKPARAEDVVYVAIRPSERSLYNPGQVVTLRDVVVDRQSTDVDGQATNVYVANAALDGARVEPTGNVDLSALLGPRLQRVDSDLGAQQQAVPSATATPGTGQTTIINNNTVQRGSYVDDFLIFMWLTNGGYFRGPGTIINNPPGSPSRGGDIYYSAPPSSSGSSPSTVTSAQAASRSTALEAARSSVSGQASGTGGGVAATNKSAADASARVSAATAKSAAVAGAVSAASAGRSISSAPSSNSSTASRSAGTTSAGSRGTSLSSSSSSSSGSKGASVGGSSGGFGGKGVSGSSSS